MSGVERGEAGAFTANLSIMRKGRRTFGRGLLLKKPLPPAKRGQRSVNTYNAG